MPIQLLCGVTNLKDLTMASRYIYGEEKHPLLSRKYLCVPGQSLGEDVLGKFLFLYLGVFFYTHYSSEIRKE
jgi:hypothetical protein